MYIWYLEDDVSSADDGACVEGEHMKLVHVLVHILVRKIRHFSTTMCDILRVIASRDCTSGSASLILAYMYIFYIYIHTHTHTHTHTHIYTYTYIYIYVYVCIYVHTLSIHT